MAAAVSEARQWDRLMQLAKIGAIPGEGVNRQALTALDREARRLVIGWAEEAGAAVSVDPAANLWFRLPGQAPEAAPVITGSHMDSQPAGGRFDGAYGVLAGIEVLAALKASGQALRRPLEVVAWTNEEGSRFAPGCTGSMAWAGAATLADFAAITDAEGITYGAALAEHLAAEADLPRRPLGGPAHAYIEAHIEQGPRLEAEGREIGIVTGIQGSRWFTVTITGASAHAGTTPLSLRRDALQAALRAIQALNALMADPADVLRFTVGRFDVAPGSSNSVAGEVRFTIDLRHPDGAFLAAKASAIAETVQRAALPCAATLSQSFAAEPLRFDAEITQRIEEAAAALGHSALHLASGAFHDAQLVARRVPSGMIFVPSRNGVSHHPSEFTSASQLATGTRVLAAALVACAK
ncbi:M20 family metallo-hydrolase [Acidisoma sp. C75]